MDAKISLQLATVIINILRVFKAVFKYHYYNYNYHGTTHII